MRKLSKEQHARAGTLRARNNWDSITFPPVNRVTVPEYLSPLAAKLYKDVATLLRSRHALSTVDLPLLEAYATAYAIYREAVADIAERGAILTARAETKTGFSERRYSNPACDLMRKQASILTNISSKLGLSILDRQRIESSLESANAAAREAQEKTDDDGALDYLGIYSDEDSL